MVHRENSFIDFNRDRLLPVMCSNRGPALAIADIDQDGQVDIFLGGSKNQPNQLLFGGQNIPSLNTSKHKASQKP